MTVLLAKDLKVGKSYKVVEIGENCSLELGIGSVVTIEKEHGEFWVFSSESTWEKFMLKENLTKFSEVQVEDTTVSD